MVTCTHPVETWLCSFEFVQGWLLNELECFLYEYDSISVVSKEKKKLLTV
jgi:hypothetical protein